MLVPDEKNKKTNPELHGEEEPRVNPGRNPNNPNTNLGFPTCPVSSLGV